MRKIVRFNMTPTSNDPQPNGRHQYFNRELSWLAFNRRVLDQALSDKNPLLERIRFLSFVSSNLDQFYEIRVAGLLQQVDANRTKADFDGIGPRELLERIRATCQEMVGDQYHCWKELLVPELQRESIHFKSVEKLASMEFKWLESYFRREVYPVLTPLAVDPAHPFPFVSNLSLNVAALIDDPDTGQRLLARVKVPQTILPRFVAIPVDLADEAAAGFAGGAGSVDGLAGHGLASGCASPVVYRLMRRPAA